MKDRIKEIEELIGDTPLVRLDLGPQKNTLLAKFEGYNLTGSVKDRMALYMIKEAEKNGLLKKGTTIIEATTGNTGIALAALSAIYGYKFIATMPEDVSKERKQMMERYGAKVILTPKSKGPAGAIEKREELAKETPNSWIPDQFSNPNNVLAHEKGIAQEIMVQAGDKIDYFVHGVGTGGTLIGVAKELKQKYPNITIVAVEPKESAIMSGDKPGPHGIQGIGEGFIPDLVEKEYIDQVEKVSTEEAVLEAKLMASEHGLLVGISSGANIAAIKHLSKNTEGKIFVTVLADRGERYLSVF